MSNPPVMELANNPLFDATRLDLASFESYMLFPDSEEDRRQAYNASFIEYSIQNPSIVGDEHLAELLYISSKTLPIFAIQERVNERFIHGMIIGEVLQRQIELNCIGDMSVTKGELIRDAVKKFNKTKDGGFLRISPKTINTYIWPRFHSVAHFWAACVAANILNDNPNGAFPCRLDVLPKFLADAEAYRIKGEAIRPRQASGTILNSEETLRLPQWLHVTPSDLAFEPCAVDKKTVPDHSGKD